MDNQIDENARTSIRKNFFKYGLSPSFRLVNDSALSDSNDALNRDLSLAQSSSSSTIITTVIDDICIMGRIACFSILNNLYGSGIRDCDNIQLNLKFSEILNEYEIDTIVQLMYNGIKQAAKNAGITIREPITLDPYWCDIGWVATGVANQPNVYISPDSAVDGDVIILTKPLGTHVAISAYQWINKPQQRKRIKRAVSDEQIHEAYRRALDSMERSNRVAAKLIRKYKAHSSTHISYLGLLEDANELAKRQKNEVSFAIMNLPIIENLAAISKACGKEFKLTDGKCPEISGGLLICLPRKKAVAYCKDIFKIEKQRAWIVGRVENGERMAFLTENRRIIEYPEREFDAEE